MGLGFLLCFNFDFFAPRESFRFFSANFRDKETVRASLVRQVARNFLSRRKKKTNLKRFASLNVGPDREIFVNVNK